MQRLIYIVNIRLPTEKAHGLQIMKTCEALAKQGVEVEMIVPRRLNYLKDDPFAFYCVEKNFKITKLWCLDLISRNIFGALGFWIESWTFYRSVKKYLHGQNKAIYYTRDLSIAYWLSKKTSHVYYEIHTLPDKISSMYRKTWNRCIGLIVISGGISNGLVRAGISEDKILIARDAVDLQQFKVFESTEDCRKKLGLPLNKKIVVYTGHIYEWKGAAILAEAVKFFPKDSNIEVYIVGGMPKDSEAFIKKYGNIDRLHIVGWRPHQEMSIWHNAADILVIPTSAKEKIGAEYTSPMKLFEYMVAERPIVASDISSLREILDETTAFFFKPDDPFLLAETLEKVIANYAESERRADRAKKIAMEKYSWKKRVKDIAAFISN